MTTKKSRSKSSKPKSPKRRVQPIKNDPMYLRIEDSMKALGFQYDGGEFPFHRKDEYDFEIVLQFKHKDHGRVAVFYYPNQYD